jgi:hypothetical protein
MFLGGGAEIVMKSSRVILSCLISTLLAAVASAQWVQLTGNPVSIGSLPGGSLVFGDKEFSDIELFGIGTGGAITPDINSVFVQGGQDDATGNYGLRFWLSWNAFSGQTINADLNFKISVLPGYDDYFIKDVAMDITGASATGTGGVNIGETVWNASPFSDGNVIASLSCSKQYGDGGSFLVDYAEFAPVKAIWIYSKDISITGGTNGAAHLSAFFQFYSQVQQIPIPEPATIILIGLGSAIMLRRKRRR